MSRRSKRRERAQGHPAAPHDHTANGSHEESSSHDGRQRFGELGAERTTQSLADVFLWILAGVFVAVFLTGYYFAAIGPAIVAAISVWQARTGEESLRSSRVARAVLTAMLAVMMGIGWYLIATNSQAPVPEEFRTPAPSSAAPATAGS